MFKQKCVNTNVTYKNYIKVESTVKSCLEQENDKCIKYEYECLDKNLKKEDGNYDHDTYPGLQKPL